MFIPQSLEMHFAMYLSCNAYFKPIAIYRINNDLM